MKKFYLIQTDQVEEVFTNVIQLFFQNGVLMYKLYTSKDNCSLGFDKVTLGYRFIPELPEIDLDFINELTDDLGFEWSYDNMTEISREQFDFVRE